MAIKDRAAVRSAVHRRIRRKVSGTGARPRLAIYRSLNHIYAQIIDDENGQTLVSASSTEKDLRASTGGNLEAAGRKAIQIVLLAQPGIIRTLKQAGLESLQQRIAVRSSLAALPVMVLAEIIRSMPLLTKRSKRIPTDVRLRITSDPSESKLTNIVRSPRLHAASANVPLSVVLAVPGKPVMSTLAAR